MARPRRLVATSSIFLWAAALPGGGGVQGTGAVDMLGLEADRTGDTAGARGSDATR